VLMMGVPAAGDAGVWAGDDAVSGPTDAQLGEVIAVVHGVCWVSSADGDWMGVTVVPGVQSEAVPPAVALPDAAVATGAAVRVAASTASVATAKDRRFVIRAPLECLPDGSPRSLPDAGSTRRRA